MLSWRWRAGGEWTLFSSSSSSSNGQRVVRLAHVLSTMQCTVGSDMLWPCVRSEKMLPKNISLVLSNCRHMHGRVSSSTCKKKMMIVMIFQQFGMIFWGCHMATGRVVLFSSIWCCNLVCLEPTVHVVCPLKLLLARNSWLGLTDLGWTPGTRGHWPEDIALLRSNYLKISPGLLPKKGQANHLSKTRRSLVYFDDLQTGPPFSISSM